MLIAVTLGIIAFLFILLGFVLKEKHPILSIVLFYFSLLVISLLASHLNTLTDNFYCDIVIKNETITKGGNFTSYEYQRECFSYDKNTAFSVFKLIQYLMRIVPIYTFLFIFYYGAKELGFDLLEKIRGLFGK